MRVRYHGRNWDPKDQTWASRIGFEGEIVNGSAYIAVTNKPVCAVKFDNGQTVHPLLSNLEPLDEEARTLFVKVQFGVLDNES